MIERNLSQTVLEAARHYPIVTLTGPWQSGKTTLCRQLWSDRAYVSLEPLDTRAHAREDPRDFLASLRAGAIIDEFQHAPDLASYLQVTVDDDPTPGRFILTGSQNLALSQSVSQSLAGRTAVLQLLPPSYDELRRFDNAPTELLQVLFQGAYPRIHDRGVPASRWLADYVATYVQRDVRQVTNVTDLSAFTTFLGLIAGATATEFNGTRIGADAGISHNTAKSWLSVLEAGYLVHRIAPWHANLRKRAVKAPKVHFIDSGLCCHLLGVRSADELRHHPLRGAIFESWVTAEVHKSRVHAGQRPTLFHFRDSQGLEVDLVVADGTRATLVEVKSGSMIASDWFDSLNALSEFVQSRTELSEVHCSLVYGGDAGSRRRGVQVVPWQAAGSIGQE